MPHTRHKADRFRPRDEAVCTDGSLEGTDPFTKLVVDRVHKDGTVDVRNPNTGDTWLRARAASLTKL